MAAYAVEHAAVARVDNSLADRMSDCMLLSMATSTKLYNIRFQKTGRVSGMYVVTQFALAFFHWVMHNPKLHFFGEILMALRTKLSLVFFHQELLVGGMRRVAYSAFPLHDGLMRDRLGELFPCVRMAGPTQIIFRLDQCEWVGAIGRLMAIGAQLLCHGNVCDFSSKPLLG